MNNGMLWFDNDLQSDLSKRIQNAAAYFSMKYGIKPDVCFVHPSMLVKEKIGIIGMQVLKNHLVRPNYFWLGVRKNT